MIHFLISLFKWNFSIEKEWEREGEDKQKWDGVKWVWKEGFILERLRGRSESEDKAQKRGEKKSLDLKRTFEMDVVSTKGAVLRDEGGFGSSEVNAAAAGAVQ